MDFTSEAQRICFERVRDMMTEVFGEFTVASNDAPVIGFVRGSALAQTAVYPWGKDAVICTRAWVVTGVELTPDLMHHLLLLNNSMRFGAFGIDEDEDIFFEHSIVGSTCDKEELKASVIAVISTADEHDDEIVRRWGGERALDHVRK